jgi:predicted phage tail protein
MNQIQLVRVHNALEPANHTRSTLDFSHGQSLADLFPTVMGELEHVYSLNGQVVEAEDMAKTYPAPGDCVVACPVPHGSDGSKNVLRMVAFIALAIFAPYVAGYLGVTGTAATAVTMATVMVGGMIINSVLPPPMPEMRGLNSEGESPTYGIDGAKNTSAEGIPVPIIYGQHRMGGNIIGNYVVNDGDTQYLHMLICAGEGPVAALDMRTVQINDQPYLLPDNTPAFKEAEFAFYEGTHNQAPPRWFSKTLTPWSVSQEITTDWKYATIGDADYIVDGLRIDFVAPQGLYVATDDGSLSYRGVPVVVECRKAGTSDPWVKMENVVEEPSGGYEVVDNISEGHYMPTFNSGHVTQRFTYTPETGYQADPSNDLIYDSYPAPGGLLGSVLTRTVVGARELERRQLEGFERSIILGGRQRTAVRRSLVWDRLAEGRYEIRYRRTSIDEPDLRVGDTVFITDVVGIIKDEVAYRNTALMAVRIRLSEQLNSIPKVTFIHGGKMVPVWRRLPPSAGQLPGTMGWTLQATANPAWIVLDLLTNRRYGGGAALSRIDLAKFRDWAEYCEQEGLEFHGVFDTQASIWDAANEIARCGRAQLIQSGTRYSMVIERPSAPVQLFNVSNIIKGTFKETWLSMAERANEVEVNYTDKAFNYEPRMIRVLDRRMSSGVQQRTAAVRIKGVVTEERAYKEAILTLNMNRLIRRTVEFSAGIDAVVCTPGDVILVQHDMPQWGFGGRTETGSTSSVLQLDTPVTMEHGRTYQAMVHFDSVQRWSGTIQSVSGSSVYLTGYMGATNIKRLVMGGIERAVDTVVELGGTFGVRVDDTTGLNPGQTVTLHDTNVSETRNVVNPATVGNAVTVSTVTLAAPLPAAPALYQKWVFGESLKTCKPFRVKNIKGSHEYRRDISAIEYDEGIWDLSGSAASVDFSMLSQRLVKQSEIITVEESHTMTNGLRQSTARLIFKNDQSSYWRSDVYLSRNGGPLELIGSDQRSVTVSGNLGETLEFKVVAMDLNKVNAPISTAPTRTHVMGSGVAPAAPITGMTHAFTDEGILFNWNPYTETTAEGVEIRMGKDGGTPASWDNSAEVWFGAGTQALVPFAAAGAGTYQFFFRTKVFGRPHQAGIAPALDARYTLAVANPAAPTLQATVTPSGVVELRWTPGATGSAQPVKEWIVRTSPFSAGPLPFATATELTRLRAWESNYQVATLPVGQHRIYLAAEAQGGLLSAPTQQDVTVAQAADGYTFVLSNDSHNLPASSAGVVSSFAGAAATMRVFKGATEETGSWTFAKVDTSVTSTLVGSTVTVTAIAADSGFVDITASRAGQPSVTRRFSLAKVRQGADGTAGSTGPQGPAGSTGPQGPTGSTGAAGAAGQRTAEARVFAWGASIPAGPTGSSTYTWATATLSAAPAGWALTPPAAVPGFTLYAAVVRLSNNSTSATDTVNWTGASIVAQGAAGTNGTNGATGPAGPQGPAGSNGTNGANGADGLSARLAYTVISSASSLSTGTRTSTGLSNPPATNAWGLSEVWSMSVPAYGANQTVWQTNGIYNPATNTTTWDTPYVSALKVGSLSAVTVNTGALSVTGALTVGASGGVFSSNYAAGSAGWALTTTGAEFPATSIRGQLTAGQIDTRNLTIRDAAGNVLFGSGTNLAASNINPAAGWLNSNVSLTPTGILQGGGGGQVTTITTVDNVSERSINRPPSWYPVGTTKEFKQTSALGLSGDQWCTLETIIQYSDDSGGRVYQYAYVGQSTWRRFSNGRSNSSWTGAWVQDLDRNVYTGDLNATAGMNLLANGTFETGVSDWMPKHVSNFTATMTAVQVSDAWAGSTVMELGSQGAICVSSRAVPVTPGATYRVRFRFRALDATVATYWYYGATEARPADGYNGFNDSTIWAPLPNSGVPAFVAPSSTWQTYSEVLTIPPGMRWLSLGLHRWSDSSAGARLQIDDAAITEYTGDLNAESNSRITLGSDGRLNGIGAGAGTSVANDLVVAGVRRIPHPGGGVLNSDQPTQNGAIWIILPVGWNYSMLRFDLEVFEYLTGAVQTYSIAGYNYDEGNGNQYWVNASATYSGDPARVRPVAFGRDTATGRPMIGIGTFAGSWSYPKVKVSNVVIGHSGHADAAWNNNWSMTWETSRAYTENSRIDSPRPGGALSGVNQIQAGNVSALVDVGAGLNNNQIGINASGQFYGGGAGTGTPVSNNQISVNNSGQIGGIGPGAGTVVDNTKAAGDNLIPDPQFLAPGFWLGDWEGDPTINSFSAINASRWTGYYAGSPGVALLLSRGGSGDRTGGTVIVQQGTYRLRIRVYKESAASGIVWAGLHIPGQAWWTAPPVNGGQQPTASIPENGWNLAAIPNNTWVDYVTTVFIGGSESFRVQPRIRNTLGSGGDVWITMELARVPSFNGVGEITGQINSGNASTFIANAAIGTAQIANAAIGIAQINTATIGNLQALNAFTGQLTVDATGHIKGGATAYDFAGGNGFWLGNDAGTYKFRIGSAAQHVRWTGTALEVKLNAVVPSANTLTGSSFPVSSSIVRNLGTSTASATGGTPPYTFQWSLTAVGIEDGGAANALNYGTISTTGASCTFLARGANNCLVAVIASCTVTDANGLSATIQRSSTGTFGSGPP